MNKKEKYLQKDHIDDKKKKKMLAIGIPLSVLMVGAAAAIPTSILLTQKPQQIEIKKYIVSFETNGGTNVNSQEVEENKTAIQPVSPTKTGYVFDKWYIDETFTKPFDWNSHISSNINLYAKFILEPKVVTHTLNFINSDSTMGSINGELKCNVVNNKTFGEINKPTVSAKDKVIFTGWYDKSGNLLNDSTMVNSDMDVIAKWKYETTEYEETVIIDSDGKVYKADMNSLCSTNLPINGTTFDGSESKKWDRSTFNEKIVIGSKTQKIDNTFLSYCLMFNQPIVIPNGVTGIGTTFMSNCSEFNQPIVIPNGLKNIGNGFLAKCKKFNQSIILPDSCESIGVNFMVQCESYNQRIILPKNLKIIENYFLQGCCSFNHPLSIPASVESIGNGFLYGYENPKMVFNQPISIPNGVKSIGDNFLRLCVNFNQPVTIGNTVTSIGESFMEECSSFNQPLILPSELETINHYFLSKCTLFNQPLSISSKIETIGYAFMDSCNSFSNWIDLSKVSTTLSWNNIKVFRNINNDIELKVASGTTNEWKEKLGWDSTKTNWLFKEI